MTYKSNINWLVKRADMFQFEAAEKVGVSRQLFNEWCKGHKYPRINQAMDLCKVINCDLNELYKEEGE